MPDLVIPALNATDEAYVLVEWLVPAASRVDEGDAVALVETSKAVSDLCAGHAGYLSPALPAGSPCRPGDVVARICPTAGKAHAWAVGSAAAPAPASAASDDAPLVTRGARELIEEHGIGWPAVVGLGKRVVKRADIEALLAGPSASPGPRAVTRPAGTSPDRGQGLPAHQQAVARAVTLSHTTIPAAFSVIKVDAGELARAQLLVGEKARAFIGPVEFVVKAVAGLQRRFPAFFAEVSEDFTIRLHPEANVGVTFDVGTGLVVPVVRAAATLDVPAIAARLMEFRVRARRKKIREEDLSGGAITLSLHRDPGIVLARPVIFPGQTSALSLCASQQELRLSAEGGVESHEFFNLGITYDHRVINGAEAARFLQALRDELESPATAWLDGDSPAPG